MGKNRTDTPGSKRVAVKRSTDSGNIEKEGSQMKREEIKRMRHLETVTALGEKEDAEKHLEELVFGAEDELLERLGAAEVSFF